MLIFLTLLDTWGPKSKKVLEMTVTGEIVGDSEMIDRVTVCVGDRWETFFLIAKDRVMNALSAAWTQSFLNCLGDRFKF